MMPQNRAGVSAAGFLRVAFPGDVAIFEVNGVNVSGQEDGQVIGNQKR